LEIGEGEKKTVLHPAANLRTPEFSLSPEEWKKPEHPVVPFRWQGTVRIPISKSRQDIKNL
jgi:hypothetical protein